MNHAVDFTNAEASLRSGETLGFSFGENWMKFLSGFDESAFRETARSLTDSLARETLQGRTFLDVGCGSGVFSLAAARLGATSVTSVDIDPNAIACATSLRDKDDRLGQWTIVRGSVLDDKFVASLEPSDIVFSWGVLHHTGAVREAVRNALRLVRPGGLACIALYNHPPAARTQMALKRIYNRTPGPARPVAALIYSAAQLSAFAMLKGKNPVRYVRSYGERNRGMSYWRDVVDWLGGLPCEFVEPDDMHEFVNGLPFRFERILVAPRGGNNEYLLRRVR